MVELLEGLMRNGRRGAVYVGVGVLQTALGFILALKAPGALGGYALVLGAINLHLFGGGALAKWADARIAVANIVNGKAAGEP